MCCAVFVISCIKVLDTPDLRFYLFHCPKAWVKHGRPLAVRHGAHFVSPIRFNYSQHRSHSKITPFNPVSLSLNILPIMK